MSARTVIVVVLALVFGLSAAVLVHLALNQAPSDVDTDKVDYVIAKEDIPAGVVVTRELLTSKSYPKHMKPADGFQKFEEVVNDEKPRSTTIPIYKGEPIVAQKLTKPGEARTVSSFLEKGWRAISIPIADPSAGLGGWLKPRDKVDVLLTLTSKGSDEEMGINDGGATTSTLLQNVEVLAVGAILDPTQTVQSDKGREARFRTVTLKVKPEQAVQLQMGATQGILHLVLRNPNDDEDSQVAVATRLSIHGMQNAANQDNQGANSMDDRLAAIEKRLTERFEERLRAIEETDTPGLEDLSGPGRRKRETKMVFIRALRGGHHSFISVPVPVKKDKDDEGSN